MLIEKHLSVSIEAEIKRGNQTIKNKLEAKFDTYNFTFQAVFEFQKDMKKIDKLIKKLIRDGVFFEMEVSIFEIGIPENINDIKTKSFDLWKFSGYNDWDGIDEKEMGVYLTPDIRYTRETNDCWYEFTIDSLPSV